jgi:endonuclease YncB( thermonuclease family)
VPGLILLASNDRQSRINFADTVEGGVDLDPFGHLMSATDQGGGGGSGGGGNQPPPIKVQRAKMVRVIDGDTVKVDLAKGPKVDVRLIGIESPEVRAPKECWGPQASRAAKQMLPRGTRVVLRSDRTQKLQDRHGRLLRYVFKHGQKDVGAVQLRKGNARVYVVGKRFTKFKVYKKAVGDAKANDRGMWGHC